MHCGPQELNADVYVNDKDKLELGNLKIKFYSYARTYKRKYVYKS